MLRLASWFFALLIVMSKCLVISIEEDVSTKVAKVLSKWHRLEAEKVALLPLSPVTRPPAIGKVVRGESPFLCVGPVMAIVRGHHVYVVDDRERKLVECSTDGKLLRQLKFPPNAPKSLSGGLSLCNDWLWIGFETSPYAFAVDLNRWQVVEERVWGGNKRSNASFDMSGRVKALFAMPDRTLYAVMPGKWEFTAVTLWKLVKINPQGDQQEQMMEGWYPCYVTSNGDVYWVSHNLTKVLRLGCAKFGDPIKVIAEINAKALGASSIYHTFEGTLIGIHDEKIICEITVSVPISSRSEYVDVGLLVAILRDKKEVKPIGLTPLVPMSARYWCLPRYSMCDGQVYFVGREDVGEISRFWLMKLKTQF